jgi:hypothetical protein
MVKLEAGASGGRIEPSTDALEGVTKSDAPPFHSVNQPSDCGQTVAEPHESDSEDEMSEDTKLTPFTTAQTAARKVSDLLPGMVRNCRLYSFKKKKASRFQQWEGNISGQCEQA